MFCAKCLGAETKSCANYRTEVKETTDAKLKKKGKKGITASMQLWVCIVAVAVIFVTGCGTSMQEENTLVPADDTAEEITDGEEASAEEADIGGGTAGEETDSSDAVSESETADEETPEETDTAGRVTIGDAAVGDIVTFGSYEQDNDLENGAEPVEWYVLDKADGEATLVSVYLLDCQPYHEELVDITWENCTLRSWLNGEFYNTAFSAEEQETIVNTNVVNEDNPDYGTEGGNNTTDKVWLLSFDEIKRYFSVDSDVYDNFMCVKATAYAKARGANTDSEGNGWWWLRSPGSRSDYPARVLEARVYYTGLLADINYGGVRPAILLFAQQPIKKSANKKALHHIPCGAGLFFTYCYFGKNYYAL